MTRNNYTVKYEVRRISVGLANKKKKKVYWYQEINIQICIPYILWKLFTKVIGKIVVLV